MIGDSTWPATLFTPPRFHSLDPPYPLQHPAPKGLQAYSGVCGHEFVDFATLSRTNCRAVSSRCGTSRPIAWRFTSGSKVSLATTKNMLAICCSRRTSALSPSIYSLDRAERCTFAIGTTRSKDTHSIRFADERRDRHSGRIWRITAKGHRCRNRPGLPTPRLPELLEHLEAT